MNYSYCGKKFDSKSSLNLKYFVHLDNAVVKIKFKFLFKKLFLGITEGINKKLIYKNDI